MTDKPVAVNADVCQHPRTATDASAELLTGLPRVRLMRQEGAARIGNRRFRIRRGPCSLPARAGS